MIIIDCFCHDASIDRSGATQQPHAAPALASLNAKAIAKKFNATSIELGYRTAVLIAPNDNDLIKSWKATFNRVGKVKGEYKSDMVDVVYDEM